MFHATVACFYRKGGSLISRKIKTKREPCTHARDHALTCPERVKWATKLKLNQTRTQTCQGVYFCHKSLVHSGPCSTPTLLYADIYVMSASTAEHYLSSRIMDKVKCTAVSAAVKPVVIEASCLFLWDARARRGSHLPTNSLAYAHIQALLFLVKMQVIAQHFLNIRVSQSLHVAQRMSKNMSASLLLSCFSKSWPSNIYLLCVRFGKGQAEYSPLACQTKHPSVSVRFQLLLSVWKQTFPLKVTLRWARFCLNPSGAPDGKVQVHVWKWWPHLLLNLHFISCNCLLFHGLLRFQPVGKCGVLQKQ